MAGRPTHCLLQKVNSTLLGKVSPRFSKRMWEVVGNLFCIVIGNTRKVVKVLLDKIAFFSFT